MNPLFNLDETELKTAFRISELAQAERYWNNLALEVRISGVRNANKIADIYQNRARFYHQLRVENVVY